MTSTDPTAQTSSADLDSLIADIGRLVSVESPSLELEALARSAAELAAYISERTGRAATVIDGPAGPHVHWSGGGEPKVLLLGHHDTVFPLGTLADRPFTVADGVLQGPGVFDMKSGVALAVTAVASLDDRSGVEMLFTADEEVGSASSRSLIEERAVACGNVLVLEASAPGGAVKTGRKGTGTFEVVIDGRAAHAGLEPEKGVNALIEAANQILRVAGFADPERGTTVTPSVATAGTADNVVPARASFRVDVRVSEQSEKERVETLMAGLTPVDEQSTVTVTGAVTRPPMSVDTSASLFPLAQSLEPGLTGTVVGGGSDGNFTAAVGVPTLDGLGPEGGGAHADHEWVDIDSLLPRLTLIRGLLAHLMA